MSNHSMFLHFDVDGANYGDPVLEVAFSCSATGWWHMIGRGWVEGSYGEIEQGVVPCGNGKDGFSVASDGLFPLQMSWDGKYYYTPPSLDNNKTSGFYLNLDNYGPGEEATIYLRYRFWVARYAEGVPSWTEIWSNPIQLNILRTHAGLPEEWPVIEIQEYENYAYHIEIPEIEDTCILYGSVSTPSNEAVDYLWYPQIRVYCQKQFKTATDEWVMLEESECGMPSAPNSFSFTTLAKDHGIKLTNSYKVIYFFSIDDYNEGVGGYTDVENRNYEILQKDIFAYDLYEKRGNRWRRPLLKDNVTEAPLQLTGDKFYFKLFDEDLADLRWAPIEEIIWNDYYGEG